MGADLRSEWTWLCLRADNCLLTFTIKGHGSEVCGQVIQKSHWPASTGIQTEEHHVGLSHSCHRKEKKTIYMHQMCIYIVICIIKYASKFRVQEFRSPSRNFLIAKTDALHMYY